MENFCFVASFVTTAPEFISLPVAARVIMSKIFSARLGSLPVKKSHTSPSYSAPAAMALALSRQEPPPTLSTLSALNLLASSIPS